MQLLRTAAAAATMMAIVLLTAGPAAAQETVFLADSTNREIWRGEGAGAQASFFLDRGDVGAGDTRRDLIVGSPGWSTNTGRVYILFSGPVRRGEQSLSIAEVIISGATSGDRFGEATAAGYITTLESARLPRDLVVGAPGRNGNAGTVYLYLRGFTNGQRLGTSDALLTITGAPAGARLGASLATGDLNGDGYREIIAGAPGIGAVYIIRGGPSVSGTIDLSVPSSAFFKIEGSAADGIGQVLAAGDLTGDGFYDLAIGASNEGGTGAVYVVLGRASDTFPATMSLATGADARFGGIDTGDEAGKAIEIAALDNDGLAELIIGAPGADGPGNSRANAGEIHIIWGAPAITGGSLAASNHVIYGATAGHREGTDLGAGSVDRLPPHDLVILAPGAGANGELHLIRGKSKAQFGGWTDLAVTLMDRKYVGDPAAGPIARVFVYDLTGEGFEDVVAGMPDSGEGVLYVSFSREIVSTFSDTYEPNDSSTAAAAINLSTNITSYVANASDVDWFKFTIGREGHVRVTLEVPETVDYNFELRNSAGTTLRAGDRMGDGMDEEILATLGAGTYWIKIVGYLGAFSQVNPYRLRVESGFFSDAFEPNNVRASSVSIGPMALTAKVFTPDDADWYRFRVAANGTVQANLTVPASADLELTLLSSTGAVIATSNNTGAGAAESITSALSGPADYHLRVTSAGMSSATENYTLTVSGAVSVPIIPSIFLGLGPHSGEGGWFSVHGSADNSFGPNAWGRLPWATYNAAGGGVRTAVGDVDGDGRDEVVLGLGSGSNGWVAILDDATTGYALLSWVQVAWAGYNSANGEVFPAVGDLDGDGRAEIVLGLGAGSNGWYQIVDDAGTSFAHLVWKQVSWTAYNSANGVTHPAVGDLDGDGVAEIVLGLGNGSGGWMEIVNGTPAGYSSRMWVRSNWSAYNTANGTTWPAVGDVDADGRGEIVVGLGPGSAGWFQVMDDSTTGYAHVTWSQLTWPAYNSHSGETHPAVGNIDGDAAMEIVLGLAEFPGNGGWFEIRDDGGLSFASRGWRNVGFSAFTANGGALFPAISNRR